MAGATSVGMQNTQADLAYFLFDLWSWSNPSLMNAKIERLQDVCISFPCASQKWWFFFPPWKFPGKSSCFFFIVIVNYHRLDISRVQKEGLRPCEFFRAGHVWLCLVPCWLPSADRSSLVFTCGVTHTEWTGSLPHALPTLSEADKLSSALEGTQRAQLSILWPVWGSDLAICSYLRSSVNTNKGHIFNHSWKVDSNFRWIK